MMETTNTEVATRTDMKESHQGHKMFASNEMDQVAGRGRRSTNKDRPTSVTSVMSGRLVLDWNIKYKKWEEGGR